MKFKYGYAVYHTVESAQKALSKLQNLCIHGVFLRIERPQPPRSLLEGSVQTPAGDGLPLTNQVPIQTRPSNFGSPSKHSEMLTSISDLLEPSNVEVKTPNLSLIGPSRPIVFARAVNPKYSKQDLLQAKKPGLNLPSTREGLEFAKTERSVGFCPDSRLCQPKMLDHSQDNIRLNVSVKNSTQ